jgi:CRP-like cAMP-binding protein
MGVLGLPKNSVRKPVADNGKALLLENAVLALLSESELAAVYKDGELAHFDLRQTVYQPGARIEAAYFPIDCVLSVVARMEDGSLIEVGTIGREGTTAVPLIMGAGTTPNESFCQVEGRAWKMPAESFDALLETSSRFHWAMNRYLQAYVNMLGQMAGCNGMHSVLERCARWLLMTQDRVARPGFSMTHEFLAAMLGSRRSGVTVAASTLQGAGYIRYSHGQMIIVNRAGLESTACECYRVAREQFDVLSTVPEEDSLPPLSRPNAGGRKPTTTRSAKKTSDDS